jgi:hypothetical protein
MLKKISFLVIVISLLINVLNARNIETIFGEDNNFITMTDVEVEQGLSVYKTYDNKGLNKKDVGIIPVRISYGIMQNMEVGLKIPYVFIENGKNSLGDVSLYQKFKFVNETENVPSFSGGIELNFPTGNFLSGGDSTTSFYDILDNDKLDIKLFFSFGKDFPGLRIFGSAGLNFLEAGDETKFDYDAGINLNITNGFKLTGEFFGFKISDIPGYESEMYVAPGIILEPNKKLNVKFAVPFGINSHSADYRLEFSMVHTF